MKQHGLELKWQVLILCLLLVSIPVILLGIVSYNSAKAEVFANMEDVLKEEARLTHDMIEITYELSQESGANVSVDEYQERVLDKVSKVVVGETGYIWIIDNEGNYVLSLNRERDGENIWQAEDADGNLFIQEMVNGAREIGEGKSGIKYYPWQNKGESKPRMKVAAYTYFPEWEWTIGPSSYVDDFLGGLDRIRNMTILICLLSIIVGSIIAYLVAQWISGPIRELLEGMTAVSEGNLSHPLAIKSFIPEIAQLSREYERMRKSVAEILSRVINTTNNAAANAEELSASAEEVNASVQQVSATVQEIAKSAQELSRNAGTAADKSKLAEESSTTGSHSAKAINERMGQISVTIKDGAGKVRALGEKSNQIGQIVETINGISEQTNLLALNAAIEAARAGDAGRGFAVVADEVRKLAEESQKATTKISDLLGDIQSDIEGSVQIMDANTKHVDEGTEAITKALASFEEIPLLIQQLNKSIGQMSAISEENAAGAEEVSASVEEVTSAMQQVAGAAQQLSKGAADLKLLVNRFKIEAARSAEQRSSRPKERPGESSPAESLFQETGPTEPKPPSDNPAGKQG